MNKVFKEVDLLHGNIIKAIIVFSIPILISNLFQQFYNMIDTMIVGHYLGDDALSSIGACSAIYDLLVGFALGMGNGMSIVVARYFGEGNIDKLKTAVFGSVIIGVLISLCIMLFTYVGMYDLLAVLHTPSSIIHMAYSYIYTITMFVFVMFAYNLCAGLLRAIGNSFVPLVFLMVSSLLNIVLDYICIVYVDLGVQGASIATVLAQCMSVILCLLYMYKKGKILIPSRRHCVYQKKLYKDLLGQGISMGCMTSIVCCGTVILQYGINGLGKVIIAGHTVARKLFSLLSMPLSAVALATSTFVSQNKGAGQRERILSCMKVVYGISSIVSLLIIVLIYVGAKPLVMFVSGSKNPVLVDNASLYLKINVPFFIVLGILLCTRNALQGLGEKMVPLISSVIELVGKIVFVLVCIPNFKYMAIIWCEPVIWILMTIQLVFVFYNNAYIRKKNEL